MTSPTVKVATLSDALDALPGEAVAVFSSDYGDGRVAVHVGDDGIVRVAIRFAETASVVVEGGAIVCGTAAQARPVSQHAVMYR